MMRIVAYQQPELGVEHIIGAATPRVDRCCCHDDRVAHDSLLLIIYVKDPTVKCERKRICSPALLTRHTYKYIYIYTHIYISTTPFTLWPFLPRPCKPEICQRIEQEPITQSSGSSAISRAFYRALILQRGVQKVLGTTPTPLHPY